MKLFLVTTLCMLFLFCSSNQPKINAVSSVPIVKPFHKLQQKITEAKMFCQAKKLNNSICFLADLSIHSGLKRFYIVNLSENKTIDSFLVGHGCGKNAWGKDYSKSNPTFSNTDGSHCSSLGKYKIGERAYSDWGVRIKYVLHGLEKTNNNALSRYIVFHSWEVVSDFETYPSGTPEGWGCPTLSNNHFKKCDSIIQIQKKPLLLWLYN